jgi:hypothetical protein
MASCLAVAAAMLIAGIGPASGYLWPELNWDMLAYTAIAHRWLLADPQAAQAAAYLDAQHFAQARGLSGAFDQLAHGSAYRQTLAGNAEAFAEVLRFYNLRPLYEAAVVAFGWCGVNFAAATVLVSAASVFAANLAVLWFAVLARGALLGAALAAGFALSPPLMTVAGYSTADALGTACVTCGAIAWLAGRPVLGAAILCASVTARTDFALTNLIVAAALLLARLRGLVRVPLASLVLLVLAYPLARTIEIADGAYPFMVLYYNTFVAWLPHPAHPGPILVPPRRFATALYWGVVKGLANGAYAWPWVPAIFLAARRHWSQSCVLATAFLLALAARILIFPEPDIRLVAPVFAVAYVALIRSPAGGPEQQKEVVLF